MSVTSELEPSSSTGVGSLTPERVYNIADTVGAIGKLATLAALDQTPEEFVSSVEMCRRIDEAQGRDIGWRFSKESRTVPYAYCQTLFRNLGLVEIGEAEGQKGSVRGARITPNGSEIWPSVAGTYLPWQSKNPQIALSDVIGNSQQALKTGVSTRIRIFELLLNHPEGKAASTEIKRALDLSVGTVSSVTSELCRIGLLDYKSKHKPQERLFKLSDSTEMTERYLDRMSDEGRVAVEALLSARQNSGLDIVNGLTILEMAKDKVPKLDSKLVWDQFLDWMKNPRITQPFIEEVTFSDNRSHRTLLSIADEWKEPLVDFVERRNKLATDPDFRLDAAAIGRSIMSNKNNLSKSLRTAKVDSRLGHTDAIEWENIMLEHVPSEGIDLQSLHALVQEKTGKNIHEKSFRKRIFSMIDLLEFSTDTDSNYINTVSNVRLKRQSFSSDWYGNARCRTNKLDPEIFMPSEFDPLVVKRSKTSEAISHCLKCDVRRPCLKTAVENKEKSGVWGGLTPGQLKALTSNQKNKLLDMIEIDC